MRKPDGSRVERTASPGAGPRLAAPLFILAVALAVRFVPGWIAPFTIVHFIGLGAGPILGVLGLLGWWGLSRRLPRRDRWVGLAIGLALLLFGFIASDPTMPQFLVVYGLVEAQIVFVMALVLTAIVPWRRRRWLLLFALAVAWLPWTLMRQDGQIGELTPELASRWSPTAEDLFLREQRS